MPMIEHFLMDSPLGTLTLVNTDRVLSGLYMPEHLRGPEADSLGCFIEITKRGAEPLKLADGEERRFLQDGDEIILRGRAQRPGQIGLGLGEARGIILPAG